MNYTPYHFKKEDAFRFAQERGLMIKERGDELRFRTCPYCRSTSDTYVFSINASTGQFKCLRDSCGAKGNMITLSRDFDFSLGNEVDEYYAPRKKYRTLPQPKQKVVPKDPALKYLQERGISEETAKIYQITTRNDADNILVFPFFDEKNQLQCIKYRKTDFDKSKDKSKEWFEKQTKPILFGMNVATYYKEPLVVCEGQIDSLSVAEAGIHNAVSVPTGSKGMTFFPYCWNFINKFPEVIIFGDHEKNRITLLDEFADRISKPIRHVRPEDYGGCKDANEILNKYGKQQIAACVARAIPKKIQQIVDLADVANVNFYAWKKMPTGLPELDRSLHGGLPYGGITILAGKPGGGKSTLASQIISNARQDGKRILVYSGELTKELFKSWLNYQVAGPQHVAIRNNEPVISTTNVEVISEWYRDHIYFYDTDDLPDDKSETVGIVELLEKAIVQYAIDVVLIDNLMTALDLDDSKERDKYERQSKFVKKLTRMSKRLKIVTILVAHQRKNNFSVNANDEVSGSGDITNLAMVTLSYESETDDETGEEYRVLKLAKNRLFGKLNMKGWRMTFEERSRRIGMSGQDLSYDYSWSKTDEHGMYVIDEDAPFEDE